MNASTNLSQMVRMAVLSDLHASTKEPGRTWVREEHPPAHNPLAGLDNLLDETPDLRADVLLCPGDLCDKADWDALPYAWERIQEFAERLGAEHVIATAGNHDLDIHGLHAPRSIDEGLRALSPDFPSHPHGDADHYWDKRVTQIKGDDWQVISLNSSLMRPLEADERDHGQVDDETLDLIRDFVSDVSAPVNVLLCHHHPQPFTRLNPDRSHMDAGDRLVRLLDGLPEMWMIVHGHKHEPYLDYMNGTGAAPTRLVAGSAGAILVPSLSLHVRNQLHLIEFPLDACAELNLTMAGQVRSWTWQTATQWRPAHADGEGLPGVAGFGFRRDGPSLARELMQLAGKNGRTVFEREHIEEWEPRIPYLLPADFKAFQDQLEDQHGCHVSVDRLGNLDRVVLKR